MISRIINIICNQSQYIFQIVWTIMKGIGCILTTQIRGKRVQFHRKNNDVLILGNGPSLNDIELEKVLCKCDEIACVNFFPTKDKRFFDIKPN